MGPWICRIWCDDLRCSPPFSNLGPGGGGHTRTFPLGDRLWAYWENYCLFSQLGFCFRISQNLNSSLRKSYIIPVPGPFVIYVGVRSMRRVSLWPFASGCLSRILKCSAWSTGLRSLIHFSSSSDSWQYFPLSWEPLGAVPGIRSLKPVIFNGPNEPLTRLLVWRARKRVPLPPAWRILGLVVLVLESHGTPFPVHEGFNPGRLRLPYLQGDFHLWWLSQCW